MTLRAWRIVKAKHAASAFDGEGARLYGGRWSSPGTRVVYVAESLSLATLEILVHLQGPAALADFVVFTLDFPEECVTPVAADHLPSNWRAFPTPKENQALGDEWVRADSSLLLRVPSAIVVHESNFLLNPAHPDFARVSLKGPLPLDIDARVLSR